MNEGLRRVSQGNGNRRVPAAEHGLDLRWRHSQGSSTACCPRACSAHDTAISKLLEEHVPALGVQERAASTALEVELGNLLWFEAHAAATKGTSASI